jgi:hypothetical protein
MAYSKRNLIKVGQEYKTNNYGIITVLNYTDARNIIVRFNSTGYTTHAHATSIRNGWITDHPERDRRTAERRRLAKEQQQIIREQQKAQRELAKQQVPADIEVGTIHHMANNIKVRVHKYYNLNHVEVISLTTNTKLRTTAKTLRNQGRLYDPLEATVYGVGRMGIGKHLAHKNNTRTLAYERWHAMLRRCYYKVGGKHVYPAYKDCTVCDEWLTFQNFADWHEQHYPKIEGDWQLDKDIIVRGNTVYSPERCKYVTLADNAKVKRTRKNKKVLV